MRKWAECGQLAFTALRSDKTKALLTIISVVIGSASLVLVLMAILLVLMAYYVYATARDARRLA